MASEIKIHLATYLKNFGIKATEQQIDKLAKQVQKTNKQAAQSANDLGGALGHLEGPLGKLQGVFGGMTAKVMAFVAAAKVGIDIGKWIYDKVIRPLFGIKDPIEELKKQNRELQRSWKEAAAAFDESMAKWEQGWQKQVDGAEKARQKVEDLAAAYLKMQAARERGDAAAGDAAMLAMQRDKFDAMAGAASPEEAAAAGKYYDILMAEGKAKQLLAKFDRDAEASAVRQTAAEKELREAMNKRAALKRQMVELDKKLSYFSSQYSVNKYGFEGANAKEETLKKSKAALQAKIDAADRDVNRRRADADAMSVSRAAETQERENIVARTQLEIDERRKAYDEYVAYVEQEDARRAEEEWQRQQETIHREAEMELKERQRIERELAAQRIDDLRKELSERERAENEARSRQSAADSSLSTAWGMYRDQSRMQAAIDEAKAQAAAEVQWQKDYERLKTWRRDWRTAEFGSLSAADEAVRQVAFAKEEKAAADRAVIETAENTRNLSEKLEELIAAK